MNMYDTSNYLMRTRLIVLLDPGRPRERRDVDARERPPPRERAYLLAEVRDLLRTDLALLRC